MPFAIVNRIIEEFNTNGISSVLRADNILDYQMSSPGQEFGLTDYQKESLEANGIYWADYGTGTILAYENRQKAWTIVASKNQSNISANDAAGALRSKYPDVTFSSFSDPAVINVEQAMEDGAFKNPYTTASKTWRGGNAGWYDTLTSLNESIRGLQRSRIYSSGATKLNTITATAARNIMKGRTFMDLGGQDTSANKVPTGETGSLGYESATSSTGINKAAVLSSVQKGVSTLGAAAAGYCAYVEIANKIQTIVHAVSNLQQMNLINGFTEAVQIVQAGDDPSGVVMNEYANNLVEKDSNGKTSIESAGISSMFTGAAIDPNDESVKTATPEGAFANMSNSSNPVSNVIADAIGQVGSFMNAMTQCTYIKGTVAVVGTIISGAAAYVTGGLSGLIELGIQTIVGGAVAFVISQVASALIDWFWDSYGEVLEKDLATAVFGEDLGNALTSGANKYLSSNHQTGGGSPATEAALISFKRQQNVVIAEEAEYQRSVRSPFDIDSQYTFLGSIVYSLVPMASTSSLGSVIKTMGGIFRNSVTNLLPSASAVAETNLINSIGNCPTLESIGIVGDAYCNPYFISDASTNTSVAMQKKLGQYDTIASLNNAYNTSTGSGEYLNPDEVINVVIGLEGITPTTTTDSNGNTRTTYTIIKNSNLYKYAHYCGGRTSDWGFADANILQDIQGERDKNRPWWQKIPIVGDLFAGIANMIEARTDAAWTSGYNCVAREPSPSCTGCQGGDECFWQNEGKYYQRFIEDQRYLLSADPDSGIADPVTLSFNEYFDEHPLDNSYEGIIARYSGMTKDDVIAALELMEGLTYLANYHPEEREMAVEMAVVNGPVECGIMNLCFTTTAPSKTPSSTNAVTPILALAPKRLNVVVSNLATTSSA